VNFLVIGTSHLKGFKPAFETHLSARGLGKAGYCPVPLIANALEFFSGKSDTIYFGPSSGVVDEHSNQSHRFLDWGPLLTQVQVSTRKETHLIIVGNGLLSHDVLCPRGSSLLPPVVFDAAFKTSGALLSHDIFLSRSAFEALHAGRIRRTIQGGRLQIPRAFWEAFASVTVFDCPVPRDIEFRRACQIPAIEEYLSGGLVKLLVASHQRLIRSVLSLELPYHCYDSGSSAPRDPQTGCTPREFMEDSVHGNATYWSQRLLSFDWQRF